jgi:hypothetical protein
LKEKMKVRPKAVLLEAAKVALTAEKLVSGMADMLVATTAATLEFSSEHLRVELWEALMVDTKATPGADR